MPADDTAARAARFGEGFLFDAWYYVALSRAVKTGKLKRYEILGEPVLISRGQDGQVFAIRDVCPHRAAPAV